MVISMMAGQPVQILRVKENHSVEFNESELERILLADNVKDRPVVVISIAGAYRQGKSFLLSFLLRYLKNNGRSDWMEDTDAPLCGFQWRPGGTRGTTGILLWDKAFLMTDSNGEEVAILLMDTQGTFDSESTMKESVTIFSLSMMTSSVQIYNVMNNIKEDDLQHLQFFADYGRLAQKENETRPFQKLLFLVRDWNWPDEFEFGSRGGKSLIASRLAITEKQATEQKTLRQSILSSFSDIDGFLLPHPGEKVVRKPSFDGRLADINEEFREKLLELVPSILAPENLLVKRINGKKLSCEHLMTLFRTYVEVFKRRELPVPASMLLATANATNVAAMDKARKHYRSEMKNMPRRSLVKLYEFHREKLTEAKKVFNDFPKLGGGAMSRAYMDVLIKELEELFDHFFKEEDENITKQQKEKAKRERERLEEQKREEQKESHRMLAKLKAETRKREKKMLRGHKRMLAELVYERAMEEETGKMSKKFNKKLERMQKEVEDALREIQRSECTIL